MYIQHQKHEMIKQINQAFGRGGRNPLILDHIPSKVNQTKSIKQ